MSDPNTPATPDSPAAVPQVKLFVVFHSKGDTNTIKTNVDSIETAKKLIEEVYNDMKSNKLYYNKERGLLIRTSELTKIYISAEQA